MKPWLWLGLVLTVLLLQGCTMQQGRRIELREFALFEEGHRAARSGDVLAAQQLWQRLAQEEGFWAFWAKVELVRCTAPPLGTVVSR